MKPIRSTVLPVLACLSLAVPALAGTLKCPPDSVKVGTVCIDLYEESVWQVPLSNKALVKKVQAGRATLANLTGGGATQLGCFGGESPYPADFPNDGNWTPLLGSSPPSPGVYALSIPSVPPSACITWFQANQACLLSGKRLLTNREWQGAAAGTPDPGSTPGPNDCNTNSAGPSNTGSRTNCKSNWGVFDMVGNVNEWVADWADQAVSCTDWTSQTGIAGDDVSCFGGPGTIAGFGPILSIPGAVIRGGNSGQPTIFNGPNTGAGVFFVSAGVRPSDSGPGIGFRCAR